MKYIHKKYKKLFADSSIVGVVQLTNILVTFILIPLFIEYLNQSDYGIWLTIYSTLAWISLLDIGIGNGLRNKLTESLSKNNIIAAKKYIGVTLVYISVFSLIVYFLVLLLMEFIDVRNLFNVTEYSRGYFSFFINLMLVIVIIDFVFKIFDSITYAIQLPYIPKLKVLIRNILIGLILIYITNFVNKEGDILTLAKIYLITTIISYPIFILILVFKDKRIIPDFSGLSFKVFKPIGFTGVEFFLIQIASLIIYSTDNLIIINLLGPEYVTQYYVVSKLFTVFIIAQTFLTVPLWSSYTEKYIQGDFKFISKAFKSSMIYTFALATLSVLLIFFSDFILNIWLGDQQYYDVQLIIVFVIYTFVRLWNSNFSTLLNGISKLKIQIYTAIFGAIINIPLSIVLVNMFNLGIIGVLIASVFSLLPFALIAPYTSKEFIYKA